MNELYDVELTGCTSIPWMAHLKTLGAFRIIMEQADACARLSWRQGVARLHSRMNRASLVDFFVRNYSPTPILAPWDAESGFYDGDAGLLATIERSTSARLAELRRAISLVRRFVPAQRPGEEAKVVLLDRCRTDFGEDAVPWLEACFVIGENSAAYFPQLASSENARRLDFTTAFFASLAEVMALDQDEHSPECAASWIANALFGDAFEPTRRTAIAKFHFAREDRVKGCQSSSRANASGNPWDYILMVEGALWWAKKASRNGSCRATDVFMQTTHGPMRNSAPCQP